MLILPTCGDPVASRLRDAQRRVIALTAHREGERAAGRERLNVAKAVIFIVVALAVLFDAARKRIVPIVVERAALRVILHLAAAI
jgi:hypothetical protein